MTDAELMAGADLVERDSRNDSPEVRRAKILSAMMSCRDLNGRALQNCYTLARRKRRSRTDDDAWDHILRFCEEAGLRPNILRKEQPPLEELRVAAQRYLDVHGCSHQGGGRCLEEGRLVAALAMVNRA